MRNLTIALDDPLIRVWFIIRSYAEWRRMRPRGSSWDKTWPIRRWIIRRAVRCSREPQLRKLRELAIPMIGLIWPAGEWPSRRPPIGRFVYDATMHSADKRERSAIMARKISIAILREREMRTRRFIPRANFAAEQTRFIDRAKF